MSEQITIQEPFSIRIQKQDFEQLLKLCSVLVDEITIHLDPEGLTVRTMDPCHVALLDVSIPNSNFEKYDVKNEQLIALRLDESLKIIGQFDKNDMITISDTIDNTLKVQSHELSYDLRLIEATKNDTPLPKIPYDCKATFPGDFIKKYLGKINVISGYVTFKNTNNKVVFSGKGDAGICNIELEKGHPNLVDISCRNDSEGTYSIEYLIPYFKAMLANVTHDLEYSSQKPLRINSKLFNVGTVQYYLAPRVEN